MILSDYVSATRTPYPFMETSYLNTTGADNPVSSADFQNLLTDYLDMYFGGLEISPVIERRVSSSRPLADVIRKMTTLTYRANEYKYSHLYETTVLVYAPIENYNMTEELDTEYKGSEGNRTTFTGSELDTTTYSGSETDITTYSGSETDITTYSGSETEENKRMGSVTDELSMTGNENDHTNSTKGNTTDTHKVSPFDTESLSVESANVFEQSTADSTDTTKTYNNRKDTTTHSYNNLTDTNTTSFDNRSDEETHSFDNREDTTTKTFNGREDTTTKSFNGREDNAIKTFTNRHDTTSIHRYGNLGVTTSQQMLQSERDVAMFNFLSIVAHDVIKQITISIY